MRILLPLIAACLVSGSAGAGPNVTSDDPRWTALLDALATGRVSDPLGGVQSLGSDRLALLLAVPPAPVSEGAWAIPLQRLTLRANLVSEQDRPYSLPQRPREIAGSVALSCEHQEGRPCGDGAGVAAELDYSVSFGGWLTAATRLRGYGGSGTFGSGADVDRGYLKLEYGPWMIQAGRDALALGPSVRSALQLSNHAVPQDGLRAALHPWALPFAQWIKVSLFYFLDRLRAPQTFPGTLLDCTRMQLDLADRVQLGGTRFLQLGGEGAPGFGGFKGFVLEHFGRTGDTGNSTSENNRLSLDASVRIPELRGARLYYELDFEDTRSPLSNSVRYDADHLLGLEIRAVGVGSWRRLFVELQKTSWISQEHGTWKTGMTNGGRTLGSPLGPDALSLWLRADLEVHAVTVSPWAEWVSFSSDTYDVSGSRGVFVLAQGPQEHRQRLGVDLQAQITPRFGVSTSLFGERVGNAAFVQGSTRLNGGFTAALFFTP